jgi:hypothetical protein
LPSQFEIDGQINLKKKIYNKYNNNKIHKNELSTKKDCKRGRIPVRCDFDIVTFSWARHAPTFSKRCITPEKKDE